MLRAEKLDAKLLVHNYGHGGGGMTLSWGTSDLAVQMASKAARANMRFSARGASDLQPPACFSAAACRLRSMQSVAA